MKPYTATEAGSSGSNALEGLPAGITPSPLGDENSDSAAPNAASNPELFRKIALLPRLERLWGRGSLLGDAELSALCLGKLKTLALDNTRATDAGLGRLGSLPSRPSQP